MQIIHSQSNIVEKVLRDKDGRLVRARFQVYEIGGRIKARLIDFVYLDAKELKGKILSLAARMSKTVFDIIHAFEKSFEVPKFAFETIYTNGSKPRAPTF